MDRAQLVEWAKAEAERLRQIAGSNEVTNRTALPIETRPRAAMALDFLERHVGGAFLRTADEAFGVRAGRPESALRRVAGVLDDWVAYTESGMADELPFSVRARVEASTDLMEQVEQLLADARVHPAAPVVLAGAALEEFLRGKCEATGGSSQKGLTAYVQHLKTEGICSAQDVKDVTSWAGQRNEAAHGNFDALTHARARIMVDGINLFMRSKSM